jgi:hypothetical protein
VRIDVLRSDRDFTPNLLSNSSDSKENNIDLLDQTHRVTLDFLISCNRLWLLILFWEDKFFLFNGSCLSDKKIQNINFVWFESWNRQNPSYSTQFTLLLNEIWMIWYDMFPIKKGIFFIFTWGSTWFFLISQHSKLLLIHIIGNQPIQTNKAIKRYPINLYNNGYLMNGELSLLYLRGFFSSWCFFKIPFPRR